MNSEREAPESEGAIEPSAGEPVTVFINYRKAEAAGWARSLYDRLAAEFGADNVFYDLVSLEPGVRWLHGIRSRSSSCTAFVALIGPRWAETLAARAESGEEDFVRSEIETALDPESPVEEVFPALVEDASIPRKDELRYVGSIKPLLNRQQLELRPSHWDADVRVLIEKLKQRQTNPQPEPRPEPPRVAGEPQPEPRPEAPPVASKSKPESAGDSSRRTAVAAESPVAAPPDQAHYDELTDLMLEEGSLLVPFLGPGTNSCDRTQPWRDVDSSYLPDSDELAAYLADRLGMKPTLASLALVSQSLAVAKGPSNLYRALRRALPPRHSPGSVHRFLAGLPATLKRLGAPDRHQMIVTTNYDNALEQAFDEAEKPYEVAVYIGQGRDKGKFVHVPHNGEPRLVANPNGYKDFPIDAFGRVERTVIMKVHGAIDSPQEPHLWHDNYVITEDDYIDYMSDGDIESIVPQQLLGQLRDSQFLFLGHEMHDWSLRVFLIRIFGDRGLPNASWAIQRKPSRLDERFWQRIGADLVAIPLDEYVKQLGKHLTRAASSRQPQGRA